MFDKVKSITLKVNLLFAITELGIHINNAFDNKKGRNRCDRLNNLLKAAKILCECLVALKIKYSGFAGIHSSFDTGRV